MCFSVRLLRPSLDQAGGGAAVPPFLLRRPSFLPACGVGEKQTTDRPLSGSPGL